MEPAPEAQNRNQPPLPRHIIRPGHECQGVWRANRAALLVDAASYFRAFDQALSLARRSVALSGWDIDSRIRLVRDHGGEPGLSERLHQAAEDNPDLLIRILAWDFAMLFAFEREPLPFLKLGLNRHPRINLVMDGEHPMGASQHQKVAVFDRRLAFCGGLDLTRNRYDTSDHLPHDPRRVDPSGEPFGPYHDVQMMVEGECAEALYGLLADRWRWAAGQDLDLERGDDAPWPEDLAHDFRDVRVAIARTLPPYKGREEVREAEKAILQAIRHARNTLYIENQYLTSHAVGEALRDRLAERDGPEILLVLPRKSSGWLEQTVMDSLRGRILQSLSEADVHGRLRVTRPVTRSNGEQAPIFVHSKVLVADDILFKVGSSNLTNRSMGLDSECDLWVLGETPDARSDIRDVRNRLLGEHLGARPEEIGEIEQQTGSLLAAVDRLSAGERTLVPIDPADQPLPHELARDIKILDPERPMAVDRVLDAFVHEETRGPSRKKRLILAAAAAAVLVLGLLALWNFTPLKDYVEPSALAAWIGPYTSSPWAIPVALGVYVAASLFMFPITGLIAATALAFDPLEAMGCAMAGSLLSAAALYGLGAKLGRQRIRKLAGSRVNAVSKRLARQGLMTILILRLLPITPFGLENLVAGASHIRFRDFIAGTFLGMVPGILGMTVLADQLAETVLDPSGFNLALLAAILAAVIGFSSWLRRRISRRDQGGRDG